MYTAYADGGVEPKHFPEAPTVAVPIALEKAGLKPEDIALWEVNEAFSVVVRIVEKVLGVDPSKINVNGCVAFFCCSCIHVKRWFRAAVPLRLATLSATQVPASSFP